MATIGEQPQRPKRSFRNALETAETEEKVRGFIALLLVLVLLALVFKTPDAMVTAPVIASTKTLAISVIAFYFGLHKGTPQGKAKAKAEAEAATRDPNAHEVKPDA